jgi:hypothetical protein
MARQSFEAWLMAGRKPLLEFLRNLTSQLLFGALAGFVVHRLTTTKVADWHPFLPVSLLVFGAVFVLAFVANASVCFEELFKDYIAWRKRALRHLRRAFSRNGPRLLATLTLHGRQRKREHALAALWLVLLFFIFVAVLLAAILTAKGYAQRLGK